MTTLGAVLLAACKRTQRASYTALTVCEGGRGLRWPGAAPTVFRVRPAGRATVSVRWLALIGHHRYQRDAANDVAVPFAAVTATLTTGRRYGSSDRALTGSHQRGWSAIGKRRTSSQSDWQPDCRRSAHPA